MKLQRVIQRVLNGAHKFDTYVTAQPKPEADVFGYFAQSGLYIINRPLSAKVRLMSAKRPLTLLLNERSPAVQEARQDYFVVEAALDLWLDRGAISRKEATTVQKLCKAIHAARTDDGDDMHNLHAIAGRLNHLKNAVDINTWWFTNEADAVVFSMAVRDVLRG